MLILALIATLAAGGTQGTPPPDFARMIQAYQEGDYRTCSDGMLSYDTSPIPVPNTGALLTAACLAMQERFDDAYAYLRRHIPLGDVPMDDLRNKDRPGLDTLRKQPQWPAFLAEADRLDRERVKHMDLPLRAEILRRVDIDQQAQNAWAENQQAKAQSDALAAVNRDNLAWLRSTLTKARQWPGRKLVGSDGANGLWLLMQHADSDLALQRRALELMSHAPAGDVSPQDVAMLTDRVLLHEGKPQHYGSQFILDDKRVITMRPADTDSEAELDARRAAVGLPSLAEYRRKLQELYQGATK